MLALMLTVNLWTLVEGRRRAWKENKYVFMAGEGKKRIVVVLKLQFERMFGFTCQDLVRLNSNSLENNLERK